MREAIEADVVKLVAQASDPAALKELNLLIKAQSKVAENDPRSFVPLDDAFHRTLAQAAGKTYAWSVIESLKSQMDRVRQLSTWKFPMARLIRQHEAVVAAIGAGDRPAAEAAMREHLRAILTDLPLIRESLPEYFDE